MKKLIWAIVICFSLVGCAAITTTIEDPIGEVYTVVSKKDALVKFERDGVKIEVDNRGKIGWIEGLMQYILAKPDIKLSNKDGNND